MIASSVAILVSALAPSYDVLLCSLAAVGLTTISGQLLMPLAGDLLRDDQRGHIIGSIASGVLTGILLSRTVSGLLADAFGWRAICLVAACNFTGGAIGSMLPGVLWQAGGWFFLIGGQAVIISIALVVWSLGQPTLEQSLRAT